MLPNSMTKTICKKIGVTQNMAFFSSAITSLQTLVVALGAGLAVWGVINLLEGYGADNPAAKSQGMKHRMPLLKHRKQSFLRG